MELPIHGLPQVIQELITEVTSSYNCPQEFVTVALFSAISSATGSRVSIYDGKYTNSLSLWWVNVARSGSNKTQPVKTMLQPIGNIDNALHEEYKKLLYKWEQEDDGSGRRPPYRTIVVGDMTEESRHTILNNNPHGVLGYYPEIKGFFDDLERYNKSGAVSRVLRLWDNDDIKVTRKSEPDPMVIKRPFMNILGDLQPALLKETFGSKTFMSSGLNQRFMFCYPDTVEFPKHCDDAPSGMTLSKWNDAVRRLFNDPGPDGHHSIITEDVITLDRASRSVYREFYNSLQRMKATADDYVASIYSKAQIQVLRLAGIIHMIHAIESPKDFYFPVVTVEKMDYAVQCMKYFINSALKVYMDITSDVKSLPVASLTRKLSQEEVVRIFSRKFNKTSSTELARFLNIPRTTINVWLNKK